jgi:hypothetical protein
MSAKIKVPLLVLFGMAVTAVGGFGREGGDSGVSGQVLGPEGKPIARARVYVSSYTHKNHADPEVRATTGQDGRFRFTATESEVRAGAAVAAVAEGFGPDWVELLQLDESGGLPALRLVKESEPIEGRVLDLENQPIAGAAIRVVRVRKMPGEDLQRWIKDMQAEGGKGVFDMGKNRVMISYERLLKSVWGVLGVTQAVQTGADGRFRLSGFGRDRLVELAIEGPGIEHRRATVLTRRDVPAGLPPFTFGSRFEFRAALAKPILGTVREKGSGQPAAGVEVGCVFVSASGGLNDLMHSGTAPATTDDQGRYRLLGAPKSRQYHVSAAGGPFFASAKIVTDTAGLEPITVDFELERGLLIRGQLSDKVTGRPVPGTVYYVPRADNPHLKDYPGFAMISTSPTTVEPDGSFAVAAIPGRGLVCARAAEDRFTRAELTGDAGETPVLLQFATFHAIAAVDVSEKAPESLVCQLALDPGRTLRGRVYGPDEKPLNGAFAAGLTAAPSPVDGSSPKPKLSEADWTAVALEPRRPRTLVFWDEEKKLGKAVLAHGDEPSPLTVRLEPLGSVAGVLVDAGGRPQAGTRVEAHYSAGQVKTLPGQLGKGIPGLTAPALPLRQATTGKDGGFRVEGLVPGIEYDLFVQQGQKSSPLAEALSLAGGECKKLGNVQTDQNAKK